MWPGLGQFYLGNRRLAAVFAVPAVLALLLLAFFMRRGLFVFAAEFANWKFAMAAAVVVVVFGAWRLVAVVQAFLCGERLPSRKMIDRAVLGGLAAVIVLSHLSAGFVLAETAMAARGAFTNTDPRVDLTTPVPSYPPGVTPGPSVTPVPTPSIDGRVTILFTGFDSAPSRGETLYDSLLIVSYDPKTNSVQMVSMPRDSTSFPMYFGDHPVVPTWLRLNTVPTNVGKGGINGSPDSPYMTLVKEVGYLAGINIDYYAAMDLNGFVKMIDMVGGIDVVNPAAIDDPYYDWLDGVHYGFQLAAGPQHLDGKHALAYVRSRKSAGDNDFGRSSRQQQVLVDLLHKMAQPDQILNVPNLISTLGSAITTNFPADQVADYMAIGQNVPSSNFTQLVLSPDTGYSMYLSNGALCLFNSKLAAESIKLFGSDSLWNGKPTPSDTCPAS